MDLWKELAQLEKSGIPVVLVTVIRVRGSTPRQVGAKMIVRQDGTSSGTIGGSAVEALVIKEALEVLREGKARVVQHTLNDAATSSTGMICGGEMEFFLEPLQTYPQLYIFGAGHVGLALARMASELGYPHWVYDDRAEFNTAERFPQAVERGVGCFPDLAKNLKLVQSAYLIIVTRCHDTDLEVLREALGKPYTYLGLICSRKKKLEVFDLLLKEGFPQEALNQIHAPIGLDIGSETPEEIAISILAEIIQIKSQKL